MERDVRYLTVGLVVALLLAGFLGFAAWQASTFGDGDRVRYTIPFRGGVGGLTKGSGVRYRGVEVGRVLAVRLDPKHPRKILVDIGVQPSTPVTADTVARVYPQGITGLSYIQLTTEAPGPPPPTPKGRQYPLIQGQASQFDRLLEDLPRVAQQVTRIADRMERVLSEENVGNLRRTLKNTRDLSERLDGLAARAGKLVGRADTTLGKVDRAADEVYATMDSGGELVPELQAMMPELEATLTNMRSLSGRLDRLAKRNQGSLDRFAGEGLEELRLFLRDGRATLAELKALARDLRANPSQLVYPQKGGGMEIPQ